MKSKRMMIAEGQLNLKGAMEKIEMLYDRANQADTDCTVIQRLVIDYLLNSTLKSRAELIGALQPIKLDLSKEVYDKLIALRREGKEATQQGEIYKAN